MSTATRIAPIAAAAVAGIVVGWLLGPDIDGIRDDVAARFNEQTPLIQQLQASVAGLDERLSAMPDAASLGAGLQEQLTAAEGRIATQADALAARFTEAAGRAPEAVSAGLDAVQASLAELQTRIDTLGSDFAEMRAQEQAAPPSAPSDAGADAATLAEEIGARGAVLLAGQAALFGGTRVDLTELDVEGTSATMRVDGGEETAVAAGETIALSPTCTVRLAGLAANAAYLASESCEEGAPAPNATPAAAAPATAPAGGEAQPQQATPPEAVEAQDGPDAAQPSNQAPVGEPPAGEQERGTETPAEGAQAVPDQQPGQSEENAPNSGEPQGGQPQPAQ